jgi:competence protein ComEC
MAMSSWSSFPFVRITLALVGGILVACYWEGSCWIAGGLLGLLLLIYTFLIIGIPRATFGVWSPWLGLLGLGGIFLLGYLRWLTHEVRHNPEHLTHWSASIEAYEAIALEDAHEKGLRSSVAVAVCRARVQGQWKQLRGNVWVSFPKKTAPKVRYGDVLLIRGQPREVPGARNPNEFDHAAFLSLSQIYHQQFVVGEKVVVRRHQPPNPVKALSFQVLRYCQSLLTQRIHHPEACAVVLALVLGQKDSLTPEVSTSYARTGTMHVLAVSGLHVGMLYGCLRLIFWPLKLVWNIRWLSPVVSLVALWFYAFVTGLSPSVLRATTMFTLMSMAPMLGRQTSIYNTLAVSAFLLLLWNPIWLFVVSFQLSYLAVLGIVYLQPRIYRSLTFSNWILDKLWLFSSVSLGAQIATAPLSVYYFHQFPIYFVMANWVVVPAALAILCMGLAVLAVNFWADLSILIAWLLEKIVLGVNTFVEGIRRLPYSFVEPIYLSASEALLCYGLLVSCLIFLHTKRIKCLIAMSLLAMLISLHTIQVYLGQQIQCKVIFYSIDHHQVIAFVKGRHSTLYFDSSFEVNSPKYACHVQPSQAALGITSSDTYMLESAVQQQEFPIRVWHGLKVAVWQGKKFIFIDKNSEDLPHLAEKVPTDFLVVEENAVITLQPLLDRLDVGTLVIGASNQRSLAQKLQKEAMQHGLHNHSLLQQGAFTVSW